MRIFIARAKDIPASYLTNHKQTMRLLDSSGGVREMELKRGSTADMVSRVGKRLGMGWLGFLDFEILIMEK